MTLSGPWVLLSKLNLIVGLGLSLSTRLFQLLLLNNLIIIKTITSIYVTNLFDNLLDDLPEYIDTSSSIFESNDLNVFRLLISFIEL